MKARGYSGEKASVYCGTKLLKSMSLLSRIIRVFRIAKKLLRLKTYTYQCDFEVLSRRTKDRTDSAVTVVNTFDLGLTMQQLDKPPNTTLFGKAVEMKFKVVSGHGKTQWFKGQISNHDGLTGKYGIYFPCDGKTVHVYPNEKDMRFGC